ncbi:hypothetical protein AAY86_11270 [Pseudomonas amygdali pv. tabaci str. ATCC 11528]|uniref:Uncharacterized protein n=5 Tax=Pseudomonas syringae group genomosp. 2 TaxID=251698 RepID=A0A0N8T2M8_PSEAJ|nr:MULTISPECIES: hypothetical protein [Pseudomonas syringae group]AXH54964.1 hypothetical protein PLA107_006215 [Pseudomonas amygdali pv. lachrymans str. M301315]KEZ25906.1 hypothetical protein A3SK_0118540 [Pseudomonas amygdali pv. tabaci str. 6605]KEZ64912.1 hypothetical protein C1E_0224955 [Pseudomonas amygdali pv. tabaci str. ATCC 11528]KIY18244.1 hypothetical protein RD00_14375 [Pseudomonas amygdali pv. tabaci]KKY53081.1 hypothetical protein AAY86_11270 [Pseudomonas amygdali pv. tabaci st
MNIGPNYISAQEWQTLFDKKNEIASPPLNKLPTEPEQKKPRDPNAEFYTTEETPWFSSYKNSAAGRAILENMSEKEAKDIRARYLENHIKDFDQTICRMYDNFHDFKQQLFYLNTELSKKHFGFTLGFNQDIQVTDPDEVLTPAEFTYLTEKLNERQQLKEDLRAHAKIVMTLLDHYTEKFGNQHTLNLESYSKVIDYGQIFSRNHIGNFMDTIIYQIERYAPKREEEPKPLVDVHV